MFKNFVLGFYKVDNFISIGIYIKEIIPLRTDIFKIYISYGVCYLSLKQIVIRIEIVSLTEIFYFFYVFF